MSNIELMLWLLWVISLLLGVYAIISLFKLRIAERFLPPWNELKDLEAILPVRRDELRQVSDDVQSQRQQLAALEGQVGELRQLHEWQQANPDAPARIQQMMVDLERSKSELADVQQKLAQAEAQLIGIAQEVQRATQEKTQLAEQIPLLHDQLAGLQRQKAEWENNLRDLEDQRRQLEFRLVGLKDTVQAHQHEIATLRQQLDTIAREKATAIAERDQVCIARDAAKADLDLTTRRWESARDELKRMEEKIEGLAQQRRRLDDEVDALMRQRDSLADDCKAARAELDKTREQLDQEEHAKRAAITERDQACAARDAARAELSGLQKSIETLKALAEGIKVELGRAGVTGEGQYGDLFAPVFTPPYLPTAPGNQNERQALEHTRDYIRSRGLVFAERVLHAFHTSLKVSDTSPLVVLAGISGTGKSELPRHYADGMGIHFLLVSVQPRWDSSQDLFGFYNYLEKRYKATELARALVQFELFNQDNWELPEGAEIDDRKDRLLLVLLDEMNLARTEYYFSEFLSKLETRRMVNTANGQDRARAEIELDIGSLLNGRKSLRLYPGQNVLFTGTMNEDESTQALSDKVIDRASVLRFWRPRKTNPDIVQTQRRAPMNGLTFEDWERWRRPKDLGPHATDVDTWIEQLNDALTRIGRPFAFRVDRAIRSYVANYPDWVPNWHKRAMADQIEQRIFPKLRGVEPDLAQNTLQVIDRVIGQLADDALRTAFNEGWKNQSTFLFRGVVRDERE